MADTVVPFLTKRETVKANDGNAEFRTV